METRIQLNIKREDIGRWTGINKHCMAFARIDKEGHVSDTISKVVELCSEEAELTDAGDETRRVWISPVQAIKLLDRPASCTVKYICGSLAVYEQGVD